MPLVHALHLVRRFFGSLDPRPPAAPDRQWAQRHLGGAEFAIWSAMSNPDQRHSIEVARAVDAAVVECDGGGCDGWPAATESGFESAADRRSTMVSAALLHDSGKNVSGLNTLFRVGATLLWPLVGESSVGRWARASGIRRRIADYWRHPELGGLALGQAGSHPLVSTWAAEHHRPPGSWSVHPAIGRILRDCDND